MANNATFDAAIAAWIDEPEVEETVEETAEETTDASTGEDTEDTAEDTTEDQETEEENTKGEEPKEVEKEKKADASNDEERDVDAKAKASMEDDLRAYKALYPSERIEKFEDIPNVLDFAKMRLGGLSVEEAARYTRLDTKVKKDSGKGHIVASAPKKAQVSGIDGLSDGEYRQLRDMFPDLTDKELNSLYNRTRSK